VVRRILAIATALALLAIASPATAAPGDQLEPFGFGICDPGGWDDVAYDAVQRDDGSVLAVGTLNADFAAVALTCAFDANGDHDDSWSGDGERTLEFIAGSTFSRLRGVALDDRGRAVVVGASNDGAGNVRAVVGRLRPAGAFDATFSGDGKVVLAELPGDYALGEAVAIDGKGRIVVAGTNEIDQQGFVARLLPDGSRDRSFGAAGVRLFPMVKGGTGTLSDLALGPGGRIVVVGTSTSTPTDDVVVIALTRDGRIDGTFSGDGRRRVDLASGTEDSGAAVRVDRMGRILVAGGSSGYVGVLQLTDEGVLAPGFGTGGIVRTTFGGLTGAGTDVLVSGSRVLVSAAVIGLPGERGLVFGFTRGGDPDASWGGDGVVESPNTRSQFQGLLRRPGGGVYAIGALKTVIGTFSDLTFFVHALTTS
jgi:uncharacterized delta-60 repeat protein